jgi:TusA-related sulfurtransferase
MKPGEVAEILLSGGDALENVPRSVWEHGYEIVSLEAEGDNAYKFIMKKP